MKKNVKTVAIVAGGILDKRFLREIMRADMRIGVDRGAAWLLKQKVIPDVAIGDFDSVTKRQLQSLKQKVKTVIEYPQNKDATDLELAVDYAIGLKPKQVVIFGGIGTRFDHTWAGIHLLMRLSSYNIYGYIVDNFNEICIVRRVLRMKPLENFRYISIFPLIKNATVTLTGFRYPVERQTFMYGSTLGVSNEIIAKQARIEIHQGIVLVIRSKD
jgi:thiamine pyrophosphokinase